MTFNGTSPTAHVYPKSTAIEDLTKGNLVVDSMVLDEVSVNVYGAAAVAFTSQEEKSRYNGIDTSGHYHYTDVWVKKDGQWQVVASHGSRFRQGSLTSTVRRLLRARGPYGPTRRGERPEASSVAIRVMSPNDPRRTPG